MTRFRIALAASLIALSLGGCTFGGIDPISLDNPEPYAGQRKATVEANEEKTACDEITVHDARGSVTGQEASVECTNEKVVVTLKTESSENTPSHKVRGVLGQEGWGAVQEMTPATADVAKQMIEAIKPAIAP